MTRVTGRMTATEDESSVPLAAIGGLRRVLRGAGFWSAIVLPFVAFVLVVVQPDGWTPLLGGVVGAYVVGALAGHCYGLEC